MHTSLLTLVALSAIASAHGNHDQSPITGPHKQLWYNTLPGDGGTQVGIHAIHQINIRMVSTNWLKLEANYSYLRLTPSSLESRHSDAFPSFRVWQVKMRNMILLS